MKSSKLFIPDHRGALGPPAGLGPAAPRVELHVPRGRPSARERRDDPGSARRGRVAPAARLPLRHGRQPAPRRRLLAELDQDFAYDALHRLAEVATSGSHGYGTHAYAYDLAGNLRFKGPAGAAGELRLAYDRTPGQPTHLAAVDYNTGAGGWAPNLGSYAADADGSITARVQLGFFVTSFMRNADGRIQGIGLPTPYESVIHHYDHTGERSEKLHLGVYAAVLGDRVREMSEHMAGREVAL